MAEGASISTGIAERYATAMFDLAEEQGARDALEADMGALTQALGESADLREFLRSPLHSRDEKGAAAGALAERMGLNPITANTLRLLARNRRLFVLPQLVQQVREMIAAAKGEVAAEVTSARPLSDEQRGRLVETLRTKTGKDIQLNATVDESLIGGLVVRVGSKMIDTSIRAKLAALQNVMKEAR